MLLLRGDAFLHTPSTLVEQDNARLVVGLGVIAFFGAIAEIVLDAQLFSSQEVRRNAVDVGVTLSSSVSSTSATVTTPATAILLVEVAGSESGTNLLVFGLPQEHLDLRPIVPFIVLALPSAEEPFSDGENVFDTCRCPHISGIPPFGT